MKNEREGEVKTIEICFGMVTENVFQDETTQHVIVELGEKNWCSASTVVTIDGKKILGLVGTTGPEDIHNITGEVWSKEQILEAYDRYFERIGGTPKEIVEIIEENSVMPPRILA